MTRRFPVLFGRFIVRAWWRHPLLALLNLAGIALGVAVVVAIQAANRASLDSFRSAARLTTGAADLEVRGEIPDDLLPAVAAVTGVRAATPMVEGVVTVPAVPGEYLRVLGVDPFTGAGLFSFRLQGAAGGEFAIDRWLSRPDAVALAEETRRRLGDRIAVDTPTGPRTLHALFAFAADNPLAGDPRIAVMDIGWAQELLGMAGRLSSIQIAADDPSAEDRIRAILPPNLSVEPPAARSREMETLLGAFQLNLSAMSVVSVIVGMFLIANSVGSAVVRRRAEIATLRACGATRGEIRLLFLGEAGVLGTLGALAGLAVAPALVRMVSPALSETISSLYGLVRIEEAGLGWREVTGALLLGLVASLAAAWKPSAEAANADPARYLRPGALRAGSGGLRPGWLALAALFLVASVVLSGWVLHGGPRILGFAAAGAVLAAFSLLVPWLAVAIAACVRPWGRLPRLAADHLVRALDRHALTIAALASAVAMAVSVTVMIHSFRSSVEQWLGRALVADLFVSPAINETAGLAAFLPADAAEWIAAQPGVTATGTYREFPVHFRGSKVGLAVLDGSARGDLEFTGDAPAGAGAEFLSGAGVAVSESFATRFGVHAGGEITLATTRGGRTFRVTGICRDFSHEEGLIFMRRELFRRHWNDERIHSLAVRLAEPGEAAALAEAFRAEFGRRGEFAIYDHAGLRARVMEIFDRTFAVTSALRAIAVIVAVAGVFFSLSVLVIEREREIGVLRAVGASRGQVAGVLLIEAALLGVAASLSGLVSGGALAVVLTWVINKAYFGWNIALNYPVLPLAVTPLWLVPAVLAAALLPGWRAARIAPARAVRFE